MDIVITTPKKEMANAAQEAANCLKDGGGQYFRRFNAWPASVSKGDKVWYVEDGYLRGYAIVDRVEWDVKKLCETTGREWPEGFYVFMNADSWKWIKPFPMNGFRGYRRAIEFNHEVIGDWTMTKPTI